MNFYVFFAAFSAALYGNLFVKLLAVAICADMVFGSLRAAKYHCWNSAVGIDGGIRKVGMVAGVLLFTVVDMLLQADLIGWVGDDVRKVLAAAGIVKLGATELFALLFILYECTSVLKNMLLCGIPIPAGLRNKVADWLEKMTDETGMDLSTGEMKKQTVTTGHLDIGWLRELDQDELLKLAENMEVAIQESDTMDDVRRKIAAVEVIPGPPIE